MRPSSSDPWHLALGDSFASITPGSWIGQISMVERMADGQVRKKEVLPPA
jgi:hypothetical protein